MKIFGYLNPKIISSFLMLCIVGALLVGISFSWFSENLTATAVDMTVSSADDRVNFGSTVRIRRYLGETLTEQQEYRCDGATNNYYLWNSELGAFATDELGDRIPISMSGLLPGEAVDFEFSYTCTDSLIGDTVEIYLDEITSQSFAEYNDDGSELASHSVLCVYKVAFGDGEGFSEAAWAVESETGVSDAAPSRIDLATDVWAKISDDPQDNYKTAVFRFSFDLEQYYQLKTSTNQLSEKGFSIGSLRIGVADDE